MAIHGDSHDTAVPDLHFLVLWDHRVHFSHLKIEVHFNLCYGACPVLHIPLLVMNRLNKTEFAIFIPLKWSLLSKDLTDWNLN